MQQKGVCRNGPGCIFQKHNKCNFTHPELRQQARLGAGLITLQETNFKSKGRLKDKLPEYEFFEAIRKKQKGGTLIGAHKNLDPVLIEEYSEDFELIVIEVKLEENM